MSAVEQEFEQLLQRFKKAQEYEKAMYLTDTLEGREWADKEIKRIVDQMSVLWNQMSDEAKCRYIDLL